LALQVAGQGAFLALQVGAGHGWELDSCFHCQFEF
jgi:hypothetical protein